MKKGFIMSPGGRKRSVKASSAVNKRSPAGIRASKNQTKNRTVTAAKVYADGFDNYTPWSGAKHTWNNLEKFDRLDALIDFIDDAYYSDEFGEGAISETELNELLWFEPETVYDVVGLYYNPDTDEVSDEPFDEEDY